MWVGGSKHYGASYSYNVDSVIQTNKTEVLMQTQKL